MTDRSDGRYDAVLSLFSCIVVQTTTNVQLQHAGTTTLEFYSTKAP